MPNNTILTFFGIVLFALLWLGETTGVGIYFAVAIIPIIYLMAEIHQPLFNVLGFTLLAFCLYRILKQIVDYRSK